jgi:hypothetical protein
MMHKGIFAAAGAVIIAGSAYGGYAVIREQGTERNREQNRESVQAEVREAESAGNAGSAEARGNRPEGAGDGIPSEDGGERADIMGRVESVGDGYVDIATVEDPGAGAGRGTGVRGTGDPSERPEPEEGETKRVYFDDGTECFIGGGGSGMESADAEIGDIEEGDIVSVWLADADGDTMKASRIIVRDGDMGPIAR